MKKFVKIISLLCSCILLFSALASCVPTESSSTGSTGGDPTSQTGSDSTSTGGSDSTSTGGSDSTSTGGSDSTSTGGSDSTSTGGNSNRPGGNSSTGGNGGPTDNVTNGGYDLTDNPLTEEEQALYDYYPQITEVMPAIHIDTEDGKNDWATKYNRQSKLNDEIDYVDATVTVENCEDGYAMSDVVAEVKVRGNYTLEYEKKPIRIKFNKKQKMLGLNEDQKFKNWVLLADWKDLSMSNNTMAYYLGNTILGSDGYYCTDFRNVEVYLNDQYWGVYLLAEQQEAKDDGRASVPEVDDDYTGTDIGYLFEYDGYYTDERNMPNGAGDPTFEMTYYGSNRNQFGQKGYTLKSDIYVDSQVSFIQSYMNKAYEIAYRAVNNNTYYKFNDTYTAISSAPAGTYASAKECVSAVIDVQSLVDTYILNEIACDADISWSSFYLSVDMTEEGNKKVTFEAPWDFDSAFGVRSGFVNSAEGMYASTSSNPWLVLLVKQDWFQEMVREKWNKLCRAGVPTTALEIIQEQKTTYQAYYKKNYERWQNRLIYGNGEVVGELNAQKDPATAQGYAADYLYNWLQKRFTYLSKQWTVIEVDENIPEGAKAYKFEAENATFGGGLDGSAIRTERAYASNNAYVGELGGAGKTLTYTVTAEKSTTAYLFMGVSKLASEGLLGDWFSVKVNGADVLFPARYVEACANGEEEWHTFVGVKVAPVKLNAGANTIVISTVGSNNSNFDYFELYSTVKVS